MVIEKIKTKDIMEKGSGGGSMLIGKKIILYTPEKQDFSINEMDKITEFFKSLRS